MRNWFMKVLSLGVLFVVSILLADCSSKPADPCAVCTKHSDCGSDTMVCTSGVCASTTDKWTCNLEATKEVTTKEVTTEEKTGADSGAQEAVVEQQVEEPPLEIPTIGEVGKPDTGQRCQGQIAKEWPFNKKVSTGQVTVTDKNGAKEAQIDASAGGFNGTKTNPFVYLDLDNGGKVAIDDFQSVQDKTWEFAFKRTVIRTNSGDSGPGNVELAKLSNTTFEAVTQAPTGQTYATDKSFDDNCKLLLDPLGSPLTAINYLNGNNPSGSNSWYIYGGSGGSVVPIKGDIYIVKGSDQGKTYKFEILNWVSGKYTVRWKEL